VSSGVLAECGLQASTAMSILSDRATRFSNLVFEDLNIGVSLLLLVLAGLLLLFVVVVLFY
jgi:hypothetical protein